MYVGRIVAIGKNKSGSLSAMYRVSSRSFPNRRAVLNNGIASIIPKEGYENDIHKNPYIAYNCLRTVGKFAVASNGSHTDPITEKLETGMDVRDALISVLYGMDFEHDQLDTPRIAAVVESGSDQAWLGIVRRDALHVRSFGLKAGEAFYVATYEHNTPSSHYHDTDFDIANADDACEYIIKKGIFADLEKPVSSVCAFEQESGEFEIALADV